MKFSIVFVSFALFLLCAFTTTSNADTIALEKRSAVFPFERALTEKLQQELLSLNDELLIPRTRVARQAPTDPEGGTGGSGGITGLFRVVIRTVLLIPRGFLSVAITIIKAIGQGVEGICNGISGLLTNVLTWLNAI